MNPSYLHLHETGLLQERIETAMSILSCCTLCPRQCRIDRTAGETGFCKIGSLMVIASSGPHFGEESPLVGTNGSGTIFFCGCNLGCLFCQNYEISHYPETEGVTVTDEQLGSLMADLQAQGCHNINFVTPSHVVPQILAALPAAIDYGLDIPLVYNSSGYDTVETLELLDGIIDIYMPDFKFWKETSSNEYCDAPDYPETARNATQEMFRQVGDLVIEETGLAERGMLFRHLVMPDGLDESKEILSFIASQISANSYVNVMDQYRPCGKAHDHPPIHRALSGAEHQAALQAAKEAGLERLDSRDLKSLLKRLYLKNDL